MFQLTERAATQIIKAAQDNDATGLALRLAAKWQPDGSIEYIMGFDDLKIEDLHITSHGVDIVFAPAYKELLQGAVMDFVELEDGDFRFIFLNPNDPHYVPPQE
jgi:iron-sulfur cluster assembly protein